MPSLKNNHIEVRFKTTAEVRSRLEHHAKRVGTDMNDIVRQGTIEVLDRLDEQEAVMIARKQANKRQGAFVPTPVEHRWGKVPGLGNKNKENSAPSSPFKLPVLSFLQKKEVFTVPLKITGAFRRWAEYIEESEDRSDEERRAEIVLNDMYEKCSNEGEKKASYEAFKEFLEERKKAKETEDVVDIGSIAVDGDS